MNGEEERFRGLVVSSEEERFRSLVRRFEAVMQGLVGNLVVSFNWEGYYFQVRKEDVLVSASALNGIEHDWTADLHAIPLPDLRAMMLVRKTILDKFKAAADDAAYRKMKQTLERKAFIEEADSLEAWLDTLQSGAAE